MNVKPLELEGGECFGRVKTQMCVVFPAAPLKRGLYSSHTAIGTTLASLHNTFAGQEEGPSSHREAPHLSSLCVI